MYIIEKHISGFSKKYGKCKDSIIKRGLKSYYANEDKLSSQRNS